MRTLRQLHIWNKIKHKHEKYYRKFIVLYSAIFRKEVMKNKFEAAILQRNNESSLPICVRIRFFIDYIRVIYSISFTARKTETTSN